MHIQFRAFYIGISIHISPKNHLNLSLGFFCVSCNFTYGIRSQLEGEPDYKIIINEDFHSEWDSRTGLVGEGVDLFGVCIPVLTIVESKICKLKRFLAFSISSANTGSTDKGNGSQGS